QVRRPGSHGKVGLAVGGTSPACRGKRRGRRRIRGNQGAISEGAAITPKRSGDCRRGRIELIPMIDVMFFLLVTFMLASLSMQNLHSLAVNLPQGHAATMQPKTP